MHDNYLFSFLFDPRETSIMAAIEAKAQACIASFHECLHKAESVHVREHSLVEEQLARFSIWTDAMRVFEPGRQSLDHRLQMAPEVQDTCAALLEVISRRLQACKSSLLCLQPQHDDDDAFQQSLCGIAEHISLLNKLSNTIHRATKELYFAETADAGAFRICDHDGNDAEEFLRDTFTRYVRDYFPATSKTIQRRLGDSMVFRGKLIQSRRSRYGTRPSQLQNVRSLAQTHLPSPPKLASDTQDTITNPKNRGIGRQESIAVARIATTLAPEEVREASAHSMMSRTEATAPSSHESTVFSPAPIEIVDLGKETDGISGQSCEDAIDAVAEAMCPFCFYAISACGVADQKKWNWHVMKDFDVYVCLFEECDSATNTYTHSSQWLEHMQQHILRWRCVSKSHEEFWGYTKEEHIEHMKNQHRAKLTDAQLDLLAEKSARPMGPLFECCPMCGILQDSSDAMEAHVAGHLMLRALRSLPTCEDGEYDPIEDGSATGSLGPNNRNTIKSLMETQLPAKDTTLGDASLTGKNPIGRRTLSSDQDVVDDNEVTDIASDLSQRQAVPDIHDDEDLKAEDVWGFFHHHKSRYGVDESLGNLPPDYQQGKPAPGPTKSFTPVLPQGDNEEDEEEDEVYDGDMVRAMEESRRAYHGHDQAAGSSRAAVSAYATDMTFDNSKIPQTSQALDLEEEEGKESSFGIDLGNFSVVPSYYYEPGSVRATPPITLV
ncbi:hypothetical protein PG984_008108 [Apiospora sp. TS-2023a]